MGYLNAQSGDEQLTQEMGQTGTDQAPGPTTFEGLGEAASQGAAGVLTSVSHLAESLAANTPPPSYAQEGGSFAKLADPSLTVPTTQNMNPAAAESAIDNSAVGKQRQDLQKWIDSDKENQGSGAQAIGGVVKGLGIAAVGGLAGGPVGAAALMGGTSADDTYHQGIAAGEDKVTAGETAAAQGVLNAAGAMIPMKFPWGGLVGKMGAGGAINVALDAAGRKSQSAILRANGYDHLADLQGTYDAQQSTVDMIVGSALGAFGHVMEARSVPSQVDAARVVAGEMHAKDAAPGIPASPDAANLHDELLGKTLDDLTFGRKPNIPEDAAKQMAENVVANPDTLAQQQATMEAAKADPDVMQSLDITPVLDEAQKAVDEAPVPEIAPGAPHPGTGSTFKSPEELAASEHNARVADLVAKHNIPAEAAADMAGWAPTPGRDALTGFYDKDEHEALLRRAIQHAADTGENVHYAEMDLRNINGRNAAMGHTKADDTIKAETQAFADELGRVGHVYPIRRGGDEFGALVMGAKDDASVQAALDRAEARAQDMAEKGGYAETPNPKKDGTPGAGIVSAFRRIAGGERPRDVLSPIDREIENRKANNGLRAGETNGAVGAQPRAEAGAPQAAGRASQEAPGSADTAEEAATKPLTPENEALLQQLETKYGTQTLEMEDGTRVTVAQLGQRMREEAAQAGNADKLMNAAVACFGRTGGAA